MGAAWGYSRAVGGARVTGCVEGLTGAAARCTATRTQARRDTEAVRAPALATTNACSAARSGAATEPAHPAACAGAGAATRARRRAVKDAAGDPRTACAGAATGRLAAAAAVAEAEQGRVRRTSATRQNGGAAPAARCADRAATTAQRPCASSRAPLRPTRRGCAVCSCALLRQSRTRPPRVSRRSTQRLAGSGSIGAARHECLAPRNSCTSSTWAPLRARRMAQSGKACRREHEACTTLNKVQRVTLGTYGQQPDSRAALVLEPCVLKTADAPACCALARAQRQHNSAHAADGEVQVGRAAQPLVVCRRAPAR